MALDAPNRKAPRRKPARKPAPKRPASRGPQGLPGPSKPVVTKKTARARKRQGPTNVQLLAPGGRSKGPQGLPGPKQAHAPGLKKSVRQEVRKERKRLHLTTKAGLGSDRSIESLVNELRIARRATSRRTPVLGGLLGHDQKYYDRSTGKKIPTASLRNPDTLVMKLATGETDLRKASVAAPVLKVLEQTTRPLHAIAGGTDAALKGKNVLKAAGRGLANKDKKTFSDVLKTAGAPKAVQSTVGFGLDVLADPTTYVTFGAGGVAKKAALDAARQAERKALTKGLTREQAQRFGQRAATRVVTTAKKQGHPDARGVTVKVAGREVPAVRRATAKVNKGVQKATPRPAKRAGSGARHVAADFNPNIKPDHLTHDEYAAVREATRTARSTASRQTHIARQRARAIQKSIGEKNYQQVLDAIEAGKIGDLPIELRKPARFLRDQFKYIRRVQTRSGIAVGEIGAKRKITVPNVTADVRGAEQSLHAALTKRAKAEKRKAKPLPSREEFIAARPKQAHGSDVPTVHKLTENIKPGPAGISIESTFRRKRYRDGTDAGWGQEMPGEKVVVARDKNGQPIGALRILLDEHGKPDLLDVAVDEAHRGKGLGSKLYAHAEKAGYAVEAASGRGGLTEAGAAFKHKRLSAVGAASEKANAKEVRTGRAEVRKASDALERERKRERAQRMARRKAVRAIKEQPSRPKGYVPHVRSEGLDEPARGMGTKSVGTRKITPSSSKARTDQRTLSDIRQSDPGKYVEDPGVIYAARMTEGARSASKATLNRRLGEMGRSVRKGKPVDLGPNEAVYHIQGSNIRKLELGERDAAKRKAAESELQKAVDGQGKNGQYVVLNEQAVDRALKTVTPSGERSSTGAVVDKVQGVWKLIATQPNPGFHLRNTAGGVQNAYLNQSGHKLVGNLVHSTRALKHLNAEEKAHNVIGKLVDPGDKGLVIDGRKKLYSDLIKEAQDVGAIRSGFAARELTDLIENKNKIRTGSHFQALKRLANNIEDVTRLATYIEARKSGLAAEKAAARSARFHFDYSDLTELERKVLRRVMPFYTFSARNIPLQMMSLIQRPGKFAQYQKVREEFAKAFGIDLDKAENDNTEAEQRSAPIYVRVNGKRVGISLGPSGLPLTDLSEFPTTANPAKLADEWMNRATSMVSPGIKTPAELWANLSFFFRAPIERETGPLVPAPSWVASAPAKVRKELGIVPDYVDKQTGKTGWGWPAKLAYATNVLPGPFSFVNRALTESDRPGQTTGNKVVGYLGLRAKQVDPTTTGINNLYDERGQVEKRMAGLRQRMNPNKQGSISADNPTPEYTRLNEKHKALTADIMRLKTKRGDVINGGRKPSGLVFNDPKINAALEKLRSENASKFDADIESKLEKLRR